MVATGFTSKATGGGRVGLPLVPPTPHPREQGWRHLPHRSTFHRTSPFTPPPTMITRPEAHECPAYYAPYIAALEGDDALALLREGLEATRLWTAAVPAEREEHRYEPGKWSIRESLLHVLDTERVFGLRALAFARGDTNAYPGFDVNGWVAEGGAGRRTLAHIAAEFDALRTSHLHLAESFDDAALARMGTASGREVSVRAMVWMMVAHEVHHRRILAERYGIGI
jgi:uncharacterized damage-inducible protein DinB